MNQHKKINNQQGATAPFKTPNIMRYTFYKENRNDQEYTLTLEQIKQKFNEYLATKDLDWVEHYNTHSIVTNWVGAPEGLNSVMDLKDYEHLSNNLHPTRLERINK